MVHAKQKQVVTLEMGVQAIASGLGGTVYVIVPTASWPMSLYKRLRALWYLLYKLLQTFVSMFDHVYDKQKPFAHEMLYFLLASSPSDQSS